ncbi:MAG: hypothetical protein ACYTGL_13040 [Planctomycetota bacterium]|jgi:hypothetical protein
MKRRRFGQIVAGVIGWLIAPRKAMPADAEKDVAGFETPEAVARAAFEAMKQKDFAAFSRTFHPNALDEFKTFALKALSSKLLLESDLQQLRAIIAPFSTVDLVKSASGADLLSAYLKNLVATSPGFDDILSDASLEILGTIEESPNQHYVITRVLFRPQPVTCRAHNGRWYQMLSVEVARLMSMIRKMEFFRKRGIDPIDAIGDRELEMKVGSIKVIGYAKDGEDAAQVLCHIEQRVGDLQLPSVGCVPVFQGESAWDHLDDEDTTKLATALREKLE